MVDMGGYGGRVSSSAQVLLGRLATLRERPVYTPVISDASGELTADDLVVQPNTPDREWDLFVGHASEDEETFVREFVTELQSLGVRVWYDEAVLQLGDRLRRKIDEGLAKSRFGVVVLSHAFFRKQWPQTELDGLVMREHTGKQILLPIWHGITHEEIVRYSPTLADRVAARTAASSVREIAKEVAARIQA